MKNEIIIPLLTEEDIECRIASNNTKGASILLYKDARCDMRILDQVFGIYGWKRESTLIDNQLFCTVSIQNPETKEWVSKQDVGKESYTEKEKGRASDAFKRACFNIGIGRELYTAPFIWINWLENEYNNGKPRVVLRVKEIKYNERREIIKLVIVDKMGTVRYSMGRAIEPQKQSEDNDFALAIQTIKEAQTVQELAKIFNDWKGYQGESKFMDALSSRRKQVESKQKQHA